MARSDATVSARETSRLLQRGLYLEYITLAWNVVGTAVIIAAAIRAGSTALAGFGLDSLIEIFASMIVVWQLKGVDQRREGRALRLIGGAFYLLALYVLVQSAYVLITGQRPGASPSGIVWLAVTVVVMLSLAWGKHVTGRHLDNPVLQTEARVTLVDAYLATAVLVGVVLNGWPGWWWADPLAAHYGVRAGREAWTHAHEVQAAYLRPAAR